MNTSAPRAVWVLAFVALLPVVADGQAASGSGRGGRGSGDSVSTSQCSPGGPSLRSLAKNLIAKYAEPSDFVRALDAAVGVDTPFTDDHRTMVVSMTDELSILVLLPYPTYRFGLLDALRKRESIDVVPVPDGVSIYVRPARIDAPDIVKIVVERDGKVVSPRLNLLKPTLLTTALGAKAMLHAGSVVYPCSAFDPDATVRVIAIPEIGTNIEVDLPLNERLMFSAKRTQATFSLVGKSSTDVEARMGKPSQIDGHRWLYDVEGGVIRVYFNDNERVVTIESPAYDLRGFKKKEPKAVSATLPKSAIALAPQPAPVPITVAAAPKPPSPLLGLTKEQLIVKYGPPSVTNAGVLYYDRPSGTLRIYLTEGRVSSVNPEDFDLASLAPVVKSPMPTTTTTAPPPADAVAKCGDGQFVYVATGERTCAGHGGVAVWFKKP
jgi:hypothetical protein